ncbi:hypothetical protein BIV01_02375 [Curtobacterium sp. MCBA15_013]|nr:hypothetical protein BIV01_02375 [Curtobacterium sp. MCBA15_013]
MLHAPRSRTRSIAAATLGALALIGSVLVATPAQALNDTGTGGVFVPATGRIMDTKNNIGGYSTPMPAKAWRTVHVTGVAGLPDDGTVGAVSVVATVADIPGQGQLFGRPDADTSQTLMGIYGGEAKQNTSFSSVLAVSADGTVQVYAETSVRLILDVQGYYTANTDGTAPGGFVPSNGKRVADSRSGTGIPKAQLTTGKSAVLQVTGTAGVPAGASAVIVNLIALNSTSNVGFLTPYATGAARPSNSFNYAGDVITTMQAQVPLSADGKITIYNANSTIDLAIDIQGYFTAAGKGGAVFTPGQGRVVDTRNAGGNLAGNETRAYDVAGKAGVPVMGSGVNAVVLTLTSIATNGGGWGRVWANGTTEPDTASLRYEDGTIRTNTITVPLGANGKINLHNVGAGATNFVIDVQGWYGNPQAPTVSCDGYAAGSWTSDVPESVNCTVGAPAASASGQYLEIDSGDPTAGPVALSETAATSSSITMVPSGGENTILATITDVYGEPLTQTEYSFGVGNWSAAPLSSFPADGQHIAGDIGLAVGTTDNSAILDGDTIRYTVASDPDLSFPVWSSQTTDTVVQVPSGTLTDGTTYFWRADVSGPTDWSNAQATASTAVSAFTPDSTVVDPDDDSTATSTGPRVVSRGKTNAHITTYAVVSNSLVNKRYTNWNQTIGGCRGPKGATCTASVQQSATVSVQTAYGITRGAVTASLGITNEKSVAYSTSETSPVFPKNGAFFGCSPIGKYYQYKIKKTTKYTYYPTKTETSGWRHAFVPSKNLIDCRFE